MNNFFLFRDALNSATIIDFQNGIKALNEVITNRNKMTDSFIRFENFWDQKCTHGYFYEVPAKLDKEYIGLSYKLFDSFSAIPFDFTNEVEFDTIYSNDCNGFKGFDFSSTGIQLARQITNLAAFNLFKNNCANQNAYNSIESFWGCKETLFPNLIFCDRVFDQISHLSMTDDRFILINEKLKKLNLFTGTWKTGNFNHKNLGLDNSPDTPTRINATRLLRTFHCPPIGDRVFSLHIKWSFGREPFRLYYYPHEQDHKVYIGYIGPKDDIGF